MVPSISSATCAMSRRRCIKSVRESVAVGAIEKSRGGCFLGARAARPHRSRCGPEARLPRRTEDRLQGGPRGRAAQGEIEPRKPPANVLGPKETRANALARQADLLGFSRRADGLQPPFHLRKG